MRLSAGEVALAGAQIFWAGTLVYLPSELINAAGPDAWLSLLLGTGAGVAVALGLAALSRRFPRADLYRCAESALGTVAGRAAGLVLVFYFLMTTAIDLRSTADFFTGIVLPQTPIVAIMVVLMGIAAWAVRLGPEVLCRVGAVTFVFLFLVLLSMPLALLGKMDLAALRPVLEHGPGPMLRGTYKAAGWAAEVVGLGVLLPLVPDLRVGRRSLLVGTLLGAFCLSYLVVVILLVFGPELGGWFAKPADVVVTMMSLGEYAERVDMVLIAIWQPAVTLRIAFALYGASVGVGRVFALNDRRPAVYPLAVLVVLVALWSWPSFTEAYDFTSVTWPVVSLAVGLGLPALVLAAAVLRKKQG